MVQRGVAPLKWLSRLRAPTPTHTLTLHAAHHRVDVPVDPGSTTLAMTSTPDRPHSQGNRPHVDCSKKREQWTCCRPPCSTV